ncbi:Piwi-domain-containing protein [Apiospora arundinis]
MVKKHFNLPEARVPEYLLPSRGSEGMIEPEAFQFLRRLRGVKFQVIIPKKSNEAQSRKTHIIERFHFDETKDGGANAMNVTFVKKDKDGKKTGEVTVLQHFKDFHGYEINRKMCPLVETKRHDYFPLEVCQILPLQRYRYKLVFEQTNTMIGYSASPPRDRIRDINDAVRNLRWATDSNLGAFGLRINDIMLNPKQPRAPAKLYFFRDGVSEGQFQHVIDTEVQAIKKVFTDNEYAKPKITVIVATKRHHIRAFLDSKNPGPGILVEDVATHPSIGISTSIHTEPSWALLAPSTTT